MLSVHNRHRGLTVDGTGNTGGLSTFVAAVRLVTGTVLRNVEPDRFEARFEMFPGNGTVSAYATLLKART